MSFKRYTKKPVTIEAVQWTGENIEEIRKFTGLDLLQVPDYGGIYIHTLEGTHRAEVGDYIIRGVRGEFYPCKPDIFRETYEEAEE